MVRGVERLSGAIQDRPNSFGCKIYNQASGGLLFFRLEFDVTSEMCYYSHMAKNKTMTTGVISYEPEADVLLWEISRRPIDYAKEIGNVIIHFTKTNDPVMMEILGAKNFIAHTAQAITHKKKLALQPA